MVQWEEMGTAAEGGGGGAVARGGRMGLSNKFITFQNLSNNIILCNL